MSTPTPSLAQLRRAVAVSEKIEKLEAELASIMGTQGGVIGNGKRKYTKRAVVVEGAAAPAKKKKRKQMSAEGRARIVAAQKARWAKVKKTAKKEAAKGE